MELKWITCLSTSLWLTSFVADACLRGNRASRSQVKIPVTRQTTGLQAALGGSIHATPYETSGGLQEPIERARDLTCDFAQLCRWRNVQTETLEWSRGAGRPDPVRWEFATQTQAQPEEPFILLASNPRDPVENGQLVSDPIPCQVGDGILSFKHWNSLSRVPGNEPTIELCVRDVETADVRGCQAVTNVAPGPSSFTISGPVAGPFEFVIRGHSFTNAPEGGFIVIDDIVYEANIVPETECPFEDNLPPETTTTTTTTTPAPTPPPTTTTEPPRFDEESCIKMTCTFDLNDEFCALDPFGEGATGRGREFGWQVTTGRLNRANPLTGVRFDYERSRDGAFAVADFPDPRQERINPGMTYVLETPELSFSEEQYLHFKRYLATEGTQLRVCTDPAGLDCLFESESLVRGQSNAIVNRNWVDEIVPLPSGNYKLFIAAGYDNQQRFNAGQVGLSFIRVFRDRNLREPLC